LNFLANLLRSSLSSTPFSPHSKTTNSPLSLNFFHKSSKPFQHPLFSFIQITVDAGGDEVGRDFCSKWERMVIEKGFYPWKHSNEADVSATVFGTSARKRSLWNQKRNKSFVRSEPFTYTIVPYARYERTLLP